MKKEIAIELPNVEVENERITNDVEPKPTFVQSNKKSPLFSGLFLYVIVFLFFSVATFLILTFVFKTDLLTKISASIGVGIFIVFVGLIFNWIFLKSYSQELNELKEHDLIEMKKCPSCKEKVLKSKIIYEGNSMKQYLKCSNALCNFKREVIFNN